MRSVKSLGDKMDEPNALKNDVVNIQETQLCLFN